MRQVRPVRVMAGVYLLALAASHGWRLWSPDPALAGERLQVRVMAGSRQLEAMTTLAFERHGAAQPDSPTVVLLHGSPGSRREVSALARELAEDFDVLAPDLPGFGESRGQLPDYSTLAHAGYVRQLLDQLAIDRVHLVGFSLGGGVALELADLEPERVSSLTLLSSVGAQEFELLGDYTLNHAVHGLQLAVLWLLHEAVPHFGVLEDFPLDVAYARNFFDTDQRPYRGLLGKLEMPVLILHGEHDFLVPVEAAREHHRIVAQSQIVLYDSDHFMAFREPARLAADLGPFLTKVVDGTARRSADARPARLAAAAAPLDRADLPRPRGLTLLLWLLLIAAATLVSEDLTCIATGLLVAQGRLPLMLGIAACFIGIFIGDLALFAAGRWLGRPWLARAPLRWFLDERRIAASSRWFERRGPTVILLSRFWPGMRLPTYFTAGLLRTRWLRFMGYFALAVALWTPLVVAGSAWLGGPWARAALTGRSVVWLGVAVLALGWALATLRRLATTRGRRTWLAGWRRRVQWEFWPPWLFYPPVVGWVLWLGIRYRSPTLFTAANPAMPAGGFVGESKGDILDALPGAAVAPYARLAANRDVEERLVAVRAFMEEHQLTLPIVVKPEVGERGMDVTIARNWHSVETTLRDSRAWLIQKFVDGPELGVFYVRHPQASRGRIFSTTRKELPEIVGNGHDSVADLIVADERAACLAQTYLSGLGEAAERVPATGERVRIVEIGTHCRGALFRDGAAYATDELETAIDRISQAYEGFYFGRYDLRAPSDEALTSGRGLQIIELNGVTSEATHIYDPAMPLLGAYRVLFEQWRLAFEIGSANRELGASVTPLSTILRLAVRRLLGRGDQPPPTPTHTRGSS